MGNVQRRFVRLDRSAARWRMVGESVVVMDLRNSMYFSVEGSVAAVWPRLEAGAFVSDLASELAEEFEGDPDQILHDLASIVDDLADRGVLVSETRPS